MPRRGLLVPHLVRPTGRLNERGVVQERDHSVSHVRVKSLFCEDGHDLMPFPCPGMQGGRNEQQDES
jgi:hypothetical protein